jgi:hypothetical protein
METMRLERLKIFFRERRRKAKLYIISGEYPDGCLLAGYAYHPRETDDGLVVDMGPYVTYSVMSGEVMKSRNELQGINLGREVKVTRRFNTHLRSVKKMYPPSTEISHYLYEAEML